MPVKRKDITHFQLDPAQPPMLTPEAHAQIDARPIDYSDIPELPDDFWAHHPPVRREKKRLVTLRLDADVLSFFQKQGRRYQTQINAVLRSYMEAQFKGQVHLSELEGPPVPQNIPRNRAARRRTSSAPEEQAHHGSAERGNR
jgi:uncharacterized protein (DUF4415 family)